MQTPIKCLEINQLDSVSKFYFFRFLERASVENKLGRSDEDFPANPLNALRILRRYVHWWTRIPEMLQCEDCFISSHVLGTHKNIV